MRATYLRMMELTVKGSQRARALPRRLASHLDAPALAAWTLAFSLVTYLALSNGGYDTIVHSQVGLAVWWLVLLGAIAGILPARVGTGGWVAISLLTAFAIWTGLAIGWSESAERSAIELGRIATYLGVLVLAIAAQGRAAARHTINGLACAIGTVTLLAVLSRLQPQAFPATDQLNVLAGGATGGLAYPLEDGTALAALVAMGVPLLLAVAIGARTLAGQAMAAAALPLSALCVYLTISRGGVLVLAVGLAAFLALAPLRTRALSTLLTAAMGSAILIAATSQRDALQQGASTAGGQGAEVTWLALIVCAGVASLQVAMGLAARHLPRAAAVVSQRRRTALRVAAALSLVAVVAVGAGVADVGDRWQQFTAAPGEARATEQGDVFARLGSAAGHGRYQLWQAAGDAHASAPWQGIGPGAFELWWARNGALPIAVRDADSLYVETLAETGFVGFALLGGLLLWFLAAAAVRYRRAASAIRLWIAAAAGVLCAFLAASALEAVWEMAAIAGVALVLGAAIVCGRDDAPDVLDEEPPRGVASRSAFALLAICALGAVVVPMAGALATGDSSDAEAEGRVAAALAASRTAQRLQPYAVTPRLVRARALEASGQLDGAAVAARAATAQEPTNWRPWLALARIEARRGDSTSALRALRNARRLNPRSRLAAG